MTHQASVSPPLQQIRDRRVKVRRRSSPREEKVVARFRNAVAIVTGGGGGIGAAICERLASEGAHVVVCDVDNGLAETVATGLRDRGLGAETRTVDITSREACTQLVDDVVATHGRIDVLVNNAGINRRGALLDLTEDDWNATFAVNLDAIFHL